MRGMFVCVREKAYTYTKVCVCVCVIGRERERGGGEGVCRWNCSLVTFCLPSVLQTTTTTLAPTTKHRILMFRTPKDNKTFHSLFLVSRLVRKRTTVVCTTEKALGENSDKKRENYISDCFFVSLSFLTYLSYFHSLSLHLSLTFTLSLSFSLTLSLSLFRMYQLFSARGFSLVEVPANISRARCQQK